jgi:hypothetical protein
LAAAPAARGADDVVVHAAKQKIRPTGIKAGVEILFNIAVTLSHASY